MNMKMKNDKKQKYYYTYKIILLKGTLAGKYYYGQHITDKLKDYYTGSGTVLKDYYKKYRATEGVTYTKEILKFYNDSEELDKAEEVLIGDLWKTDPNCLNLKPGGSRPPLVSFPGELNPFYGKHHTEKTKEVLRKKNKGRIPPNLEDLKKYAYKHSPAVDQYSKDGNLIKSWDHLTDASKALNIKASSISSVTKGNRLRAGGFVWRLKGESFNKYRTTDLPQTEDQKNKRGKIVQEKLGKLVAQYKNNTLIAVYPSARNAGKETLISNSSITAVCRGKRKTAGGFKWKYIE